ncbi:hypothetical protein PISL3812_04910 [Talaromyces islandicus]|uniref:Uncharacterized protein n=1 Tax=Talaromyces islandicus TaxID=28573 RepID=A0A0U1LWX8_TALIS|nr:hypothetical protein PISL3812_04910 [Talaromyces islandicus]
MRLSGTLFAFLAASPLLALAAPIENVANDGTVVDKRNCLSIGAGTGGSACKREEAGAANPALKREEDVVDKRNCLSIGAGTGGSACKREEAGAANPALKREQDVVDKRNCLSIGAGTGGSAC